MSAPDIQQLLDSIRDIRIALVAHQNRRARLVRRRSPRQWQHQMYYLRTRLSVYNTIVKSLQLNPVGIGNQYLFQKSFRVDMEMFEEILHEVGPMIQKQRTHLREPISPGERLAITLNYLAYGTSFGNLNKMFMVSGPCISRIIGETCLAIVHAFMDRVIVCPSTQAEWTRCSDRFKARWNFEHCLLAIDGKHVRIRRPENSVIKYRNYKKFFSVILFAAADADYRFRFVEVGAEGKAGDAGIFNNTPLAQALANGTANIPPPEPLQYDDTANPEHVPYFLIGDDAFAMKEWLLKPFPYTGTHLREQVFNLRLSRARRCIEHAFGILSARYVTTMGNE